MKNIVITLFVILLSNASLAKKVCTPPIIKSEKEIEEKLKICDEGDKLLLYFDIKLKRVYCGILKTNGSNSHK